MTEAQHALAAIKAYVTSQPGKDVRAHGRHVWEAVIEEMEGYDAEATAEADPSHTNEQAVFADGGRLVVELNSTPGKPVLHQTRCAWHSPTLSAKIPSRGISTGNRRPVQDPRRSHPRTDHRCRPTV